MEWYQILTLILSLLSLLGLGVVTKFFWEDLHTKKVNESKEVKERKQKERHNEIVSAVKEVTDPQFKTMNENFEKMDHRLDISEECDRASLRNGLMQLYYSCAAKGYRTEDDSKNYREMHEAYNKAGGNSFIDSDVSQWFDDLPLKPNGYQPVSHKKKQGSKE